MTIVAVFLLSAAAAPAASIARETRSGEPGRALTAHVRLTRASRRLPPSFLGLSVEVSELSEYARAGPALDRVLDRLRSPSGGALRLRVGGKSADHAYWQVPRRDVPHDVVDLDDPWVVQLAGLARRDRLQVTLNVNLAVHSPAMAARFASAVSGALGPRLAGVAIGNEPNLYHYQPSLDGERIAGTMPSTPRDWTRGYSASEYRDDFVAYAQALERSLPGVALLGPETTNIGRDWRRALRGLAGAGLRTLTVHHYPFSSCWSTDSPFYPRIPSLLGEPASAGLARAFRGAIRFAHREGLPLEVSELNSMSCGGAPGVADSFATALWAPDALFELARAGVRRVDWHVRPRRVNAPFDVGRGDVEPRPELYGLALFDRTTGADGRLTKVRSSASRAAHLKVWAVASPERQAVLLIDKGPRAARVSVSGVRGAGPARLERLLAPTVRARRHVTLGGRRIGHDGRWHGRMVTAAVPRRHGRYHVAVPGYSAALLLHRRR